MYDGKKSVAETIVYGALDQVERGPRQDPVKVFHEALDNVKPHVEVRSRRVGGATYQVPVEVRPSAQALAIRWLINAARAPQRDDHDERLSGELMDAANNRGTAVKKREDTHKMAEANRPSRITAGNPRRVDRQARTWPANTRSKTTATSASWPTSMPARRRRPSASSTTPASPQDRRSPRRRRDHGLDGAGAGARHHHHVGRDHLTFWNGDHRRSTSSTPRATSTSPSRWSARCACSTAPSRCSTPMPASSRSPRPCGARPTSTSAAHLLRQQDGPIGADFYRCVEMIVDRLGAQPLVCSCRSAPRASSRASST
jgi:small subunit ribosomal protein S7